MHVNSAKSALLELKAYREPTGLDGPILARNLDAFFGVQNLFDKQYYVGTLPTTIGSPRLVNGGLRFRFEGK